MTCHHQASPPTPPISMLKKIRFQSNLGKGVSQELISQIENHYFINIEIGGAGGHWEVTRLFQCILAAPSGIGLFEICEINSVNSPLSGLWCFFAYMCCLLKILKDTRNGPHQHKALKRRNQGQPPATKTGRGLARKAEPQAAKYEDARHPSAHKYHIMDVGARGSKTILKFRRGLMATI